MSHSATIAPANQDQISLIWKDRWGIPVFSIGRSYQPEDVEGLALQGEGQALLGLATWNVDGANAELVTIDTLSKSRGLGSQLLRATEKKLADAGVQRLWLVTSNDNLAAFSFYIRRGYRLVKIHQDFMEQVRLKKDTVPDVSIDGIEIRDMWQLEKRLSQENRKL